MRWEEVCTVVKRRWFEWSNPCAAARADRRPQHRRTSKQDLCLTQRVRPLQDVTDTGHSHPGVKRGHCDNHIMPRRRVQAGNTTRHGRRPRPPVNSDLRELPAQSREQARMTSDKPTHQRNIDIEAIRVGEHIQHDT